MSLVLFIEYLVVEDHGCLVSSHRAHATYLVKVAVTSPHVNLVDLESLKGSLFGLCEALRRQETVVRKAAAGCAGGHVFTRTRESACISTVAVPVSTN